MPSWYFLQKYFHNELFTKKKKIRGQNSTHKKFSTRNWVGIFYTLFLRFHLTYFNKLQFVRKFWSETSLGWFGGEWNGNVILAITLKAVLTRWNSNREATGIFHNPETWRMFLGDATIFELRRLGDPTTLKSCDSASQSHSRLVSQSILLVGC